VASPPGTGPAPTRCESAFGGKDTTGTPARNGPGDSSSGPLDTDRHPAENPGEFTAHGTPISRQSPTRRAVVVSGFVEVDLSRHVDRASGIYDDATAVIHRSLSGCPAGVDVRVRLGRAIYVFGPVIDVLAELTAEARSVEVVGSDPRGPAYVVPRLRERLEVVV
jgi:hypothetical protein